MFRQFALALVGLCMAISDSQSQSPLEEFAQLPQVAYATLSPDGSRVAYFTTYQGTRVVAVRNLDTGEAQLSDMSSIDPRFLRWADDRVLLLSASVNREFFGVRGNIAVSATISLDTDNNLDARQLLRNSSQLGQNFFLGRIVGIEADSGHVLIPAFDRDGNFDLFAADPLSRRVRRVAEGRGNTRDWIIDASGAAVARNDLSNSRDRQTLWLREDGAWERLREVEDISRPAFSAQGLLPGGEIAISTTFINENGASIRGLYALDNETGHVSDTVFEHSTYDLDEVLVDPYSNAVIGVTYEDVYTQHVWFDDELTEWQNSLDATFPDQVARITSWSRDRRRMIISVEGASQAPMIYLFDAATRRLNLLGSMYGSLGGEVLPARTHFEYPARDGTMIPAYVTRPEGDGPFPTVILPHGGPAQRELGGFDYLAHFLASRGYAVLQPNFRGSSGYGWQWQSDGFGEWGTGLMQHDVTDGLQAMIQAGYTDPERVCIVGWSYGGYSALAGAAFTPDRYRCAAAIAPATDLPSMMTYVRQRYGRSHWSYDYWSELMSGDSDLSGNAQLRAISPAQNAERIQIPILLIHGEEDSVVPIAQSEQMERALRRANVPVRFLELDGGDHSLTDFEMRVTLLTELENFLDTHIGE